MARRYLVSVPVLLVVERSDTYSLDVVQAEQSLSGIYRSPQWNGSTINLNDVIGVDGDFTVKGKAFPNAKVLEVRDANDVVVYDARKDSPQ